ncbi:hypothetical protein [Halorarius litoreus]|uniref:hypothetical protein n=1 Tax=Halorarius litoreus TaxID=2962676 RepID=UPI0020CB83F8|nr:hypothetical protein [Halorarius litoreus]
MGLFRDLGRRAEKLKREASDAAQESAAFECADCERAIFADRETCPDCGSEAIVRRGGASEDADAENADDAT